MFRVVRTAEAGGRPCCVVLCNLDGFRGCDFVWDFEATEDKPALADRTALRHAGGKLFEG